MEVESSEGRKRNDPVWLNVGGETFCASVETLTWHPGTFFTGLFREDGVGIKFDSQNRIFIDRDPALFKVILYFLRTRRVSYPNDTDLNDLLHEVEFFGISEMSNRIRPCLATKKEICGGIIFSEMLQRAEVTNDPVCAVAGHGPVLTVAHTKYIELFRYEEHHGWQFKCAKEIQYPPERIQIKCNSPTMHSGSNDGDHCIIAYTYDSKIMILRVIGDEFFEEDSHDFDPSRAKRPISTYSSSSIGSSVPLRVEHLRFIGTQLMGVSERSENIAFWNTKRRGKWQQQKLEDTILCLESVSTFVYMGCDSGRIHFTDLEKFPLRTKDNSLLVTELYTDPMKEPITALAVSYDRNPTQEKHYDWETLELCYGTREGTVRVVVQSPGFNKFGLRSLQLLQTYKVHCSPITNVALSGRFLISVCASNHVRTWAMTRFRGTLSTQPGSAPFANFHLTTSQTSQSLPSSIKCGPYGDVGNSDETQIFCQLPMQLSDTLLVRAADKGARIGTLTSVNGSPITTFLSHDFESLPRMGLKPFRLVMTGHLDGSVQVWDLTKPLEQYQMPQNMLNPSNPTTAGDITTQELIEIAQKADEAKIALTKVAHSS